LGRDDSGVVEQQKERTNDEWVRDLQADSSAFAAAIRDLREYLLKAVFLYYHRRRSDLSHLARDELAQMAEDSAQDAILKILDKLDTFRGDSKFTTWAYRVAINQAAGDLRRRKWDDVSLDAMTEAAEDVLPPLLATFEDPTASDPDVRVTRDQIWALIAQVIENEFTERQRTVFLNQYFRGVPPDVIADQLGTNRNNIYKISHDGRVKLKRRLEDWGLSDAEILAAFQE
jgi:RNA polymerase sigma-70 factor (ECF subfamily)